jgi:AcrR family transcriptional regulator
MGEELQRTRILRAMAEEMAERENPHTVTVVDVVARANISRRAFHGLYSDCEECVLGAFEWGLQLAGAEMRAAYSRESRWSDGVRSALSALLGLIDREPALAQLCVVNALGAGDAVLQRRMEAIEALCEYVDRGRLQGSRRIEPPELAAEGVVGAVLAVIHTRLLSSRAERVRGKQRIRRAFPALASSTRTPLSELLGPLTSLILLPYMGAAKAGRELSRSTTKASFDHGARSAGPTEGEPIGELDMRLTYRTTRVLQAIDERPGASNREVANEAGVVDQGQISRLLSRLEGLGLVANMGGSLGGGSSASSANSWVLTPRGEQVARAAAGR